MLIGAILTELVFCIVFFCTAIAEYQEIHILILLLLVYIVLLADLVIILFITKQWENIIDKSKIIIKSSRYDLFVSLLVGSMIIFFYNGFSIENYIIANYEIILWILILLSYFIVFRYISIYAIYKKNENKNNNKSMFLSDNEIDNKNDDIFNLKNEVKSFATSVYDNNSSNNLIFGVDAPWGTGKSSFINLCKEYWEENHKNKTVVYTFNPTAYENQENVFDKFLFGFVEKVKEHYFCPELRPIIKEYAKIIGTSFSFHGFNFSVPLTNDTVDALLKQIESTIAKMNKKIIVVIDDLDRLDITTIKKTLFIIKKAFSINNVTYILCYDSENLINLSDISEDYDNNLEFFEKYINVKISLFIDYDNLYNHFINKTKENQNGTEPQVNVIDAIKEVYDTEYFSKYLPFIGDVRKMKKLINFISILSLTDKNLYNIDFNKMDLLNLILIYLNYPRVFRKIYEEETNGRRGFFSAVTKYDRGYPSEGSDNTDIEYKNSTYYNDYLKSLSKNQKNLLNMVFKMGKSSIEKLTLARNETTSACFNRSWFMKENGNLEKYLNLIIKNAFPKEEEENAYYNNIATEVLNGKNINDVLWHNGFKEKDRQYKHERLIKVLARVENYSLDKKKADEIINYIVKNIDNYSRISYGNKVYEIRYSLLVHLARSLDNFGYGKKEDRTHNDETNIVEIAYRIFGVESYSGKGILDTLKSGKETILAVEDLIRFNNICQSQDISLFNLQRAISYYTNTDNIDTIRGTYKRDLHLLSDTIADYFRDNYIIKKVSIFDEIDKLTLDDLCGRFKNQLKDYEDIYITIDKERFRLKVYISFQLINLYKGQPEKDEEHKNEIRSYLLNGCFNPNIDKKNYEDFLDYMLMSFPIGKIAPSLEEYQSLLGKGELLEYWKANKEEIKRKHYENMDKTIYIGDNTYTYDSDLQRVYDELDKMLD